MSVNGVSTRSTSACLGLVNLGEVLCCLLMEKTKSEDANVAYSAQLFLTYAQSVGI